MKQTAVQWLQENLPSLFQDDSGHYQKLFQQALAMEKEQIINAAGRSCQYMCYNDDRSAEQYYNETYKGGEL
jgi:hypothetical protein